MKATHLVYQEPPRLPILYEAVGSLPDIPVTRPLTGYAYHSVHVAELPGLPLLIGRMEWFESDGRLWTRYLG